jgi:hypothetical protein
VTTSSIARDSLRPAAIVLFWLPLAATWFMMALEGPYIAAIVARMPEAALSLAAFGVATSLAWLIESPIMMLLSAATALVRDRASYLALRRFMTILNAAVTAGMVVLVIPPVFDLVANRLMGLPPAVARLAHEATAMLIFWPAAIGYRRFYQGILVRHHLTRRVAYGTVIRLVCMSVTAAILAITASVPGAVLGTISLLAGVVGEAAASRFMARKVVAALPSGDPAEGSLLTLGSIGAFYLPLALTSVLSMGLIPLVTFGLARGAAPVESLAVWPVVSATVFMFRSGGIAFQEVVIALSGPRGANEPVLRRTGAVLAVAFVAGLALLALTPLHDVWLGRISGLSARLVEVASWPIRILVIFPALEYLLSIQRARWIVTHRTGAVTVATALEFAGLGVTLLVTIGAWNWVGAIGGALAMLIGRLAANGYLFLQGRRAA